MKNKVKITQQNSKSLFQKLQEIQKSARVNVIDSESLVSFASEAEAKLAQLGIPKSYRLGATFLFRSSGPWAKAYKFGQGATMAELIRGGKDWYLKSVIRTRVYPLQRELRQLTLTLKQDAIAMEKLRGTYSLANIVAAD
ncbi:MAG: hypothetical protein WC100_13420 [Sterolibacterium sp.]